MKLTHPAQLRQYYLDWLRIIAFAILIPYHVGMYYVSWEFHIKSAVLLPSIEPWMRAFSPWRMDLLFLVSGAATAHLLQRRGTRVEVLRHRASRLLWPLVFGMLVIVPPQSYQEVVQRFDYQGGYLDFMRLYLSAYSGFCDSNGACLILPTWNHLWYLPYLFFYTVVLWLISGGSGSQLNRLATNIDRRAGAITILAIPIGFLMVSRMFLRPRYPITHALLDDWFAHSQYFAMFVFGAILARTQRLIDLAEQIRWVALALAIFAWAVLVAGSAGSAASGNRLLRLPQLVISIQQWCAIIAALGFGHRRLNFDSSARRYLNEAVFPMYIVHQTLIIIFAVFVSAWAITPAIELPLLVLVTGAACLICHELVRRVNCLRLIFGLGNSTRSKALDPIQSNPALTQSATSAGLPPPSISTETS